MTKIDREGLLPCPKCGGSGSVEEQNPFFDINDDDEGAEEEFHTVACSACTGSGTLSANACPHCGSTDVFVERDDLSSAYVFCNQCSSRGPVGSTEGDDMEETPGGVDAIIAWNRRTSPVGGWEPPEGFVLVPREPTDAMIEAGLESLADSTREPTAHIDRDPLLCYRSMLHASPALPGEEG